MTRTEAFHDFGFNSEFIFYNTRRINVNAVECALQRSLMRGVSREDGLGKQYLWRVAGAGGLEGHDWDEGTLNYLAKVYITYSPDVREHLTAERLVIQY